MNRISVTRRLAAALALSLSLVFAIGPAAVRADCPPDSGITIPFLSDAEFRCAQITLKATMDYLGTIIDTRQDCHRNLMNGVLSTDRVDCKAPLEVGTGDDAVDARLRKAEARLARRILTNCTGVALDKMGYPTFCPDLSGAPYEAFDHNLCMQNAAKSVAEFLLEYEHPPFPLIDPDTGLQMPLDQFEIGCADSLSRHSANMFRVEVEERGKCLLKQVQRLESELTDCRAEVDPLSPQTGRDITDNNVVMAHNFILRAIANECPAIDLGNLGFPHQCPAPDLPLSVFPLSNLVECMFRSHHAETFRFVDLMFPCSTMCGNGFLDLEEQCDDGDNDWGGGELCRINCTRIDCGDPNDDGVRNATDSLFLLQAAVGLQSCDLQVCDVNSDLRVLANDALQHLQFVVGLPVELTCPLLSVTCGNGFLEDLESCDDGDNLYQYGDYCNATCRSVACGDTDDSGLVNILDAQYVLHAAVGNVACTDEICDVTGNAAVNSTDALRVLMRSVGLFAEFNCPAPPETPVFSAP